MFWGCVSYTGTGNLVKIDGRINAAFYQKILEENLHSSARKLRMGRTWMFQYDNDPNVQFMQDSPRIYRNWRHFAKKNGQLYHLRQ